MAKPPGLDRFHDALRSIADVSKEQVEKKIAAQKKARAKVKRKKKK